MADPVDDRADLNSEEHLAGLSDSEAASRLARFGFQRTSALKIALSLQDCFRRGPRAMLLLLLACGSTYLSLGDLQDSIILLAFVGVVIAITLYQERKTERALDALRDLSSPRALVPWWTAQENCWPGHSTRRYRKHNLIASVTTIIGTHFGPQTQGRELPKGA